MDLASLIPPLNILAGERPRPQQTMSNKSDEGSSSPSSPALKRSREDTNEPERHPRLWYDDGNIILQAERTQFKFYKGLLARHSQVFADMLAVVPHNQEALHGASAEGCPVVELTDAAQDVRFMLLWLLEP